MMEMPVVPSMLIELLRGVGSALDGIDIALCAFDEQDRTLAWNDRFLEFFPEHAGHVCVGEPYAQNLRRFYEARLAPDEMPLIERYIREGVARHRNQRRPYEFDHRGGRLRVSAFDLGTVGRVRVWRKVKDAVPPEAAIPRLLRPKFDPNASLLLERIADGVLVVDSGDFVVWANRAFLALYGLASVDEALGLRFQDIYLRAWHGRQEAAACQSCLALLKDNQRFSGAPYEIELPDERWVRVVEQRGDEVDGRGYFVHVDITTQKRQQQALQDTQRRARESEERYRLLAEFSSDVTVALSGGVVTYVSPAVFEVLGWRPEQVVGRTLDSFCHPADVEGVARALQSLSGAPEADYRARALRADGGSVWVEARARLTRPGDAGEMPLLVINIRNIAARKATEDELAAALARLESIAATDGLTGLSNRRRFDEALATECRRAQREKAPLALLLVDLDRFKSVNDRYGHQVGDDVLRAVAGALATVTRRAGDVVARYGGEEFALLLPNTPAEFAVKAAGKAQRAVRALDAGAMGMPPGSRVTVSIGVACTQHMPEGFTGHDLVQRADEALFAAKREGRNRSVASW